MNLREAIELVTEHATKRALPNDLTMALGILVGTAEAHVKAREELSKAYARIRELEATDLEVADEDVLALEDAFGGKAGL